MDMLFDCAIIGGGPAGLNAALVLGRARRNTILFDNDNPRNAVTRESHGFITRDGIKPKEFREIAHKEIGKYPSVVIQRKEVTSVTKNNQLFELVTSERELRDKPLVVVIDDQVQGFHFIQTIYNWSKDLVVCTNGRPFQNSEQKRLIRNKGIKIMENKIINFVGKDGQMEKIIFENGESVVRKGGFVLPKL